MSPGIALYEAGSRGLSAGGFCRAELAWREPRWISLRRARIAQAGLGSAPAQDRADPDLRATASDEIRIAAPLLVESPEMLQGGAGAADAQDVIAGPLLVEMCISLSSGAFCTRERRLELHFRVRSARLGTCRGRRPSPRQRRLSESVAKAPIAPERAKTNVDIPSFFSPPIRSRGAFATDSDTPPPESVPGAPPAPPRTRPSASS